MCTMNMQMCAVLLFELYASATCSCCPVGQSRSGSALYAEVTNLDTQRPACHVLLSAKSADPDLLCLERQQYLDAERACCDNRLEGAQNE